MVPAEFRKYIASHLPPEDQGVILSALTIADQAHAGQRRKGGQPYITHPIAVAQKLITYGLDRETIAAGLLHDVPEDTAVRLDEIRRAFGPTVADLVAGITKVGQVKYRGLERYVENLQKMFVAMAQDVRVMIIKFADRLHNLETLDALPRDKQLRIARESIEVYAPLAHRLGMGEIKGQLEDLSFPFVLPKEHAWIMKVVGPQYQVLESIITDMTWDIRRQLTTADVTPVDIHGRRKHLYSLYRKVIEPEYQRDLSRVTDLVAMRVIMPNLTGCYAALGVIHRHWKPLPHRFKDYIAQPKPNGYRSLHTTVFGPTGLPVEIQIRDQAMHEHAEYGVAAHWRYSESGKPTSGSLVTPKLAWIQELSEWRRQVDSPEQFMETLKIDALQRRIFCFTPKGDVIDLPEGATVIDFAYHVHSDLGDRCTGARINHKMSAVNTVLRSGDVVDIVTDKRRKAPNPDWLEFVRTQAARSRIRRARRGS